MEEIGDSCIYINEIVSVILFILSFPIAYLLASILGDVLWYFIFLVIFWVSALCIFLYDIFSYEKDKNNRDVEDKSFGRDVVHYAPLKKLKNDDTLDFYTATLKPVDTVTPICTVEEIGEYAECPYCGSNIRETFYELGGIVRCNKCGAFHHRECFEYYGKKCGSSSCKLREA